MEVILGFGQHHVDITRAFAQGMGEKIVENSPGNAEATAKDMAADLGTFKNTGWKIGHIRRVNESSDYEGQRTVCVEGTYCHYRDDHPMGPDGFASFEIPFCLTVITGDPWGERIYVAV